MSDPIVEESRVEHGFLGVLAGVSGLLLLAMVLVTLVDVVARALGYRPLAAAYELVEIFLGLAVFIAMPIVTLRRRHLSVGIAPPPRGFGRLLRAFGAGLGVIFLAALAWSLWLWGVDISDKGESFTFIGVHKGPLVYVMAASATICAGLAAWMAWRGQGQGG